mmetsp:Transcript_22406/g.45488  ORF Transcript_22406/g.45488 Transcript_22406/m.45488 type:complete len:866 (-) Transcript_22406:13-2610(-)
MAKRPASKQTPKAPKRATRSTFRRTRTGRIIDSTPVSMGGGSGRKSHYGSEVGIKAPTALLADPSPSSANNFTDPTMASRVGPMKNEFMPGKRIAKPEESVRPGEGAHIFAVGPSSGLSHGTTTRLPNISQKHTVPRATAMAKKTVDDKMEEKQSADSEVTYIDANIVGGGKTNQSYATASVNANAANKITCDMERGHKEIAGTETIAKIVSCLDQCQTLTFPTAKDTGAIINAEMSATGQSNVNSSVATINVAKNKGDGANVQIRALWSTESSIPSKIAGGWSSTEICTASSPLAAATDAMNRDCVKTMNNGVASTSDSAISPPQPASLSDVKNEDSAKTLVKGDTSEHNNSAIAVDGTKDLGGQSIALAPGKSDAKAENFDDIVVAESGGASALKANADLFRARQVVDERLLNPKKRPNPVAGCTASNIPNLSTNKAKEATAGDTNKTNKEPRHRLSSVNESNLMIIRPYETPTSEYQFQIQTMPLLNDAIMSACEASTNEITNSNVINNGTVSNQTLTLPLKRKSGVFSEILTTLSTSNFTAQDNNSNSFVWHLTNMESTVIDEDKHREENETNNTIPNKIMSPPAKKVCSLFHSGSAGRNLDMMKRDVNFYSSQQPLIGHTPTKTVKMNDSHISKTSLHIDSISPADTGSKNSSCVASQANSQTSSSNIGNNNLTTLVHHPTTWSLSASETKHSNGEYNLASPEENLKRSTNYDVDIPIPETLRRTPYAASDLSNKNCSIDSFSSHQTTNGPSTCENSNTVGDKNATSTNEHSKPSPNDNGTYTSEMKRNPFPPASNIQDGKIDLFTSHQKRIETIARKEALRHVEMAWRAQQRLVQRCLAFQLQRSSSKALSQQPEKRGT